MTRPQVGDFEVAIGVVWNEARKMSRMFKGERVDVRPATLADRWMVWEWSELSDVAPLLMSSEQDGPSSFDDWCAGWEEYYFTDESPERGRGFIILFDETPVGFVAYNDINPQHRRTELDIWMSGEARCNKGHGPDALRALCGYLYSQIGIRKIYIQPSARNPRAVHAYEKAGFERCPASVEEIEAVLGGADHHDSVLMIHRQEAV